MDPNLNKVSIMSRVLTLERSAIPAFLAKAEFSLLSVDNRARFIGATQWSSRLAPDKTRTKSLHRCFAMHRRYPLLLSDISRPKFLSIFSPIASERGLLHTEILTSLRMLQR